MYSEIVYMLTNK